MRVSIFSGKLVKLSAEALVTGCFEDVRPLKGLAGEIDWLYGGVFSSLLSQGRMTGKRGDALLLATQGKLQIPKVLLIGLGPAAMYDYPVAHEIARTLSESIMGLQVRELAVELSIPVLSQRAPKRDRSAASGGGRLESAEESKELDMTSLMESFLKGIEARRRTDPFDLTFVVRESEKARTLQQRIMNGKYLWKDSHATLGSS